MTDIQRTESKSWPLEFPTSELFFFCYLSSPSCFLPCCFCYKKKCIWCCFQNSKLSCFTSFTISMQLLRYFSPVFLFYFNHAFVFWIYFTWMNSELKLELKSRMLCHRLEMLSLFLRQVWDLKGSKFERSVWVISVFIIHLWLLKTPYTPLRK